jgi:hypothetical protein
MKRLTSLAVVLLITSGAASNGAQEKDGATKGRSASKTQVPATMIKVPGKYEDRIKDPPEYIPETWDMMFDRPHMWDYR